MKRGIFVVILLFAILCPAFLPAEETFVFSAKVAADQYYRDRRNQPNQDWVTDLEYLIDKTNREFKKHGAMAQIKITGFAAWQLDEKTDSAYGALVDLERQFPTENLDLSIGLTAKNFEKIDASGWSRMGHILIRDAAIFNPDGVEISKDFDKTLLTVLHELGHFFRLGHSKNPESVMLPYWSLKEHKFTEEEVELINKNAAARKNRSQPPY